ncbi:MAG: hypothetical protein L0Z62_39250 [Gemmataceae bacterium]|nr:hypothetical protein [Gemmataceae bacterium]
MTVPNPRSDPQPLPPSPNPQPGLGRRVLNMTLLWVVFGIVCGVTAQPPNDGWLRFIAGAVAGVLVLPVFGVVFGLLGAQVRPTLFGGTCGSGVGALTGLVAGVANPLIVISAGVLGGALVGGTFSAAAGWARSLVRAASERTR